MAESSSEPLLRAAGAGPAKRSILRLEFPASPFAFLLFPGKVPSSAGRSAPFGGVREAPCAEVAAAAAAASSRTGAAGSTPPLRSSPRALLVLHLPAEGVACVPHRTPTKPPVAALVLGSREKGPGDSPHSSHRYFVCVCVCCARARPPKGARRFPAKIWATKTKRANE